MMTTVFECPAGYVTDHGEPIKLVTRGMLVTAHRYSVWKFDNGKPRIAHGTDDLDEAMRFVKAL